MPSVRSVTCCCLLWMMFSVQLVTPGSPGTAQLSGHRTARFPRPRICNLACRAGIGHKYPFCHCRGKRDAVSSSMAV
uniref:Alpha/kappa-conotoxin pl14a n=1 Tax=Conus planorbis TaxID=97183 RepID=CJEA_CONPO|nr:RecName: Full=Alpha/kappa-conotoxin pl14a; AltName: Full=Conotoxin PlXIVA; Flags: Precursor [Conus planorbis]ABE27006.1 conotoxin pl14a precursor [Conus planorbis]